MAGEFLNVRPGDPITAEIWKQLLSSTDRASVLYGGENVRIVKSPHGTLLNAKNSGLGFLHPWRVTISRTTAQVYPGLVNGGKPTIKDPVTGEDKALQDRPPPVILLNDNIFSASGIGWIALQITTDKTYKPIKKAEVIQCQVIVGSEVVTDNPFFFFGLPGIGNFQVRYPLARLQRVAKFKYDVFQVAMFNLNWIAKPPALASGTAKQATQGVLPRHFFWPV
jgi:hypothetical protein